MKLLKYFFAFVAILISVHQIRADNESLQALLDSANQKYADAEYQKAITYYQQILDNNYHAGELYYNLGNCYFKTGKIGLAILNYERAKKILPDDKDIQNNLQMANLQIEDKMDMLPKLFLSQWKDGLVGLMSERDWSLFCLVSFLFSLVLLSIYFLSSKISLRKFGLFAGLVFFVTALSLYFVAQQSYKLTTTSSDGIILSPSITVLSSPNQNGTKLFILHEGSKVELVQTEDEWSEIKLANGNVGWIKNNDYQPI
jgi:tetratricopeptide (TPR) repeat protein